MSQPDPSPTQASSRPQPSLGNKHGSSAWIRDAAATETKACRSAFCSWSPPPLFCCGLHQNLHSALLFSRVRAMAPQQLRASVAETLPPSPPLTWRQSKLQHCPELVLSSLCSQPVPRDTFLWLPEASQEEKPSWAPPRPAKLFIVKGQIIFSSVACSQFHTISCGMAQAKKNQKPNFYLSVCIERKLWNEKGQNLSSWFLKKFSFLCLLPQLNIFT